MGISVWLFMWMDDKITKIDDHKKGWVLGGKPIKYKQIKEELGISRPTYVRWVAQLLKYPYIEATRTPYGISFKVLKAHKKFRRDVAKMKHLVSKNETSLSKNETSNIRHIQYDNNSKTSSEDKPRVELLKFFIDNINPHLKYNNKTQNQACKDLLKAYGFTKVSENLAEVIKAQKDDPYCPRVTTPYEFWTKWAKLKIYFERKI